jgi:hypothetical protein
MARRNSSAFFPFLKAYFVGLVLFGGLITLFWLISTQNLRVWLGVCLMTAIFFSAIQWKLVLASKRVENSLIDARQKLSDAEQQIAQVHKMLQVLRGEKES